MKVVSRPTCVIVYPLRPPTDEEHLGTREPPDDLWTLWIEYDAHGELGLHSRGNFLRSARTGLLMMVGLPSCTWSNISKKHGGDGLSWLTSWLRQKEINMSEPRLK